jgi:hypothetical protein
MMANGDCTGFAPGGYVPVTVTYPQPPPAVCPDCGRCRTCGQPGPQTMPAPITPIHVWPTWTSNPTNAEIFWNSKNGNTTGYNGISLTMSDALAGEVR